MDGIFISYRRDDSAGYAGRLYDRLAAHFGVDRVFMDVERIEPGTDFVVAIEKAVASCRVLIVLIGDEWLEAKDANGHRRLDDPHDFIRLETSAALARDIRVLPVLLDGTPMPRMDALPVDLQPLVRRQAVELTHKQWEATAGELIVTLEKILNAPVEPPPSSAPDVAIGAPKAHAEPAAARQEPEDAKPNTLPAPPASTPSRRPVWIGLGIVVLVAGAWLLNSQPKPGSSQGDSSPPLPTAETSSPPQTPPRLTGNPERLDFGALDTGEEKSLAWQLNNAGGEEAQLRLALEGPDAGQFSMPVETCSGGVRAGSQCSVSILYHPDQAGGHSATLVAQGSAGTVKLTLAGSASAPVQTPAASAQPAPLPAPAVIRRPEILTLGASPVTGGAKVCYRVKGADTVSIEPSGGRMANAEKACVSLSLSEATTLTLVAANRGGEVTRQVRASPAAPATERSATADGNLPASGDTWVYRSQGKWANSPKRLVSVTVDKTDGGLIYETMTLMEPNPRPGGNRRSSNAEPGFVDWSWLGWEFSPWLATSEALRDGQWSGIPTPEMSGGWGDWYTTAKVAGRERVTVPAGSFAAVKVQVWAKRRANGGSAQASVEPTDVVMHVWYAPNTRRYVKMERSIKSATSLEIERDTVELVKYHTR